MAYDGTLLKARNLIGVYNPDTRKRVLLCAHWDTRPYADEGEEEKHHTPIDGANDGASGVGVLLEIARQIQLQAPTIGIDIVFFDAEDYGTPTSTMVPASPTPGVWGHSTGDASSCTRLQGPFRHPAGHGRRQRRNLYYEGYSRRTANQAMQKIWKAAHRRGYDNFFIQSAGGEVTDDHIYVNQFRQIPCVDIIDFNPHTDTGFNPNWHTVNDNMEHIDKATLQAVGQTVMDVIYNEK